IGLMSRFLDPGSIGTVGSVLITDGVESTDPGVSTSAFREMKINSDPYSVRQARPGFGRIEIETKTGQQDLHGDLNFTFRDSSLNAREAFADRRLPDLREMLEGMLTGPVGKSDQTSFLVSLNANQDIPQAFIGVFASPLFVKQPMRNLLLSGQIDHRVSERNR